MPNRRSAEVGNRFGRLTVESFSERIGLNGGLRAICLCDCGTRIETAVSSLRRNQTVSCGCVTRENAARLGGSSKTHGMSKTRTYNIWSKIKSRVENKNDPSWPDYGGRGIRLCQEWGRFESFLSDMGVAPDGFMIDRINVNGNYEKENCRWVPAEVSSDNKRCSRLVSFQGKVISIEKAARMVGIPAATLRYRFSKNKELGGGLDYA